MWVLLCVSAVGVLCEGAVNVGAAVCVLCECCMFVGTVCVCVLWWVLCVWVLLCV